MRRSRKSALRVVTLGRVTLVSLLAGAAITAGYSATGSAPEPGPSDGGAQAAVASADRHDDVAAYAAWTLTGVKP